MKVILENDPETGIGIQKPNAFYRKMAKKHPWLFIIADIPEELFNRYEKAMIEVCSVRTELASIFKNIENLRAAAERSADEDHKN
jgi:hypothetical protein